MRKSLNTRIRLIEAIEESRIDIPAMITVVQDVINLERTGMEGNKILKNEVDCLTNHYKILNAKRLLSLLRRDRYIHG
jgi:hypothetical protein